MIEQSQREVMDILRAEIYDYGDIVMLANRTGLEKSTLYSIRSGRTKWPRGTTIDCLLHVFNLRITLMRSKNSKF